jgi:hypothetical protein
LVFIRHGGNDDRSLLDNIGNDDRSLLDMVVMMIGLY